jgi:hypothetical protein
VKCSALSPGVPPEAAVENDLVSHFACGRHAGTAVDLAGISDIVAEALKKTNGLKPYYASAASADRYSGIVRAPRKLLSLSG